MIIKYQDMRQRCGIEPEVARLWVRKGYVQGDEQGAELRSLERFLSDIGPYALAWMPTGRSLTVGYRAFMGLWPQVVGDTLAGCMVRLESGASLETLAAEQGLTVSSLQYQLRKATRKLKEFLSGVSHLQPRSEGAAPQTVGEATGVATPSVEDQRLERLRAPLRAWGLSAKCVHALDRAGVGSLQELLVVNQACGRSGMLRQIAHFGKGAYKEVERLLLKEGLIRQTDGEYWQVSDPVDIDRNSALYLRYRSQKSETADNREHNWVKQALIMRSKLGR